MKAAVYLGSRPGRDPKFLQSARTLGELLARRGIEVIYGGAKVGTMGALYDGVQSAGGKVTGVFPKNFGGRPEYVQKGLEVVQSGQGYAGYTFIETENFDERIRTMEKLADICILLPGSYGSMHEFISFFEGNELGRFHKPMAILNTDGYYDPLLDLIRNMQKAGFSDPDDLDSLLVAPTPEELVQILPAGE